LRGLVRRRGSNEHRDGVGLRIVFARIEKMHAL
jgi:hypothetical protein